MKLLFLLVCSVLLAARAQADSPSAMAQLEAAALSSNDGHWADGSTVRPGLAAAGDMGKPRSAVPAALIAPQPPPFDDGADGVFLGMGTGFLNMESPALAVRRVPVIGTPLAVVLFLVLLIPAVIWGLVGAALIA